MKIGDSVYPPQFCTVQIKIVFATEREAYAAGYCEPTYYKGNHVIGDKVLDMYCTEFAAVPKGGSPMSRIRRVSLEQMQNMIESHIPLGLFLTKEGRTWVAVDNSTGDAWMENFSWKRQAIRWLRGNFEVCR